MSGVEEQSTPAEGKTAIELMEPIVHDMGWLDSYGEAATVSMAVSLKRLADAVCGDDKNTGIHRVLREALQ